LNRLLLLFVVIVLPVSISAQISVVDVTTDTVNVFSKDDNAIKSNKIAMAASIALPGLGQQYIGKRHAAFIFAGLDIAALFGAIFCETYSRRFDRDAYGFAASRASIDGTGKDALFWNNVGNHLSMEDYNTVAGLNGTDQMYNDPSYSWRWAPDEADFKQYQQMRFDARKLHTVASVCLGAMVLNRIISLVDIRASSKYKKSDDMVSFSVNPAFSPGLNYAGLSVSAHF